ncbi:hypothetical protein BDF22DRAFT_674488 [Syncephalis plumigaleata]|nr:hypothetical protein BDF22DRAFT_674488 [Syncephalis plumigaleata]
MSLLSKPLSVNTTKSLWCSSIRVAALAWSCSAWAKVSLLDRRRQIWLPVQFSDQECRYLSSYYLLVAVVILRGIRPNLPRFPVALTRQHTWRTTLLLAIVVLIDEWIHWTINRQFERERRRWVYIGRPAPAGKTDDDCMICQGVGLSDKQPCFSSSTCSSTTRDNETVTSSSSSSSSYHHSRLLTTRNSNNNGDTDPTERLLRNDLDDAHTAEFHDEDDRLESFCTISDHVAHRSCIRAWWMAQNDQLASQPQLPVQTPPFNLNTTPIEVLNVTTTNNTNTVNVTRVTQNASLLPSASSSSSSSRIIHCPCCRRQLKLTIQLSRQSKSSTDLFLLFLKHQTNNPNHRWKIGYQILRYKLSYFRLLLVTFIKHLCQQATLHRSLITIGFGLASFTLSATDNR